MNKLVLVAIGVCAAFGPVTASAQVRTVRDAVAAIEVAEDAKDAVVPAQAVPIGSQAEWVTPDDYPPQALREELSGRTRVRLDLDVEGVPTRCSITSTSGSEVLDSTTCARLMERARFRPTLNDAGQAVPAIFETSVFWSLPNTAPHSPPSARLNSEAIRSLVPNGPIPVPIEMSSWLSVLDLEFDPAVPGDRTAMYVLDVDSSGRATDCTIAQGSGDGLFDRSLCNLLELNAKFDVSGTGPGRFPSGLSIPAEGVLALSGRGETHSSAPNYSISAFIDEDGRVSACRWRGSNAPTVDAWRICNRSSWADQRNVDGSLVRGVVEIGVSQREIDGLETAQ
jgi:TonB family protein